MVNAGEGKKKPNPTPTPNPTLTLTLTRTLPPTLTLTLPPTLTSPSQLGRLRYTIDSGRGAVPAATLTLTRLVSHTFQSVVSPARFDTLTHTLPPTLSRTLNRNPAPKPSLPPLRQARRRYCTRPGVRRLGVRIPCSAEPACGAPSAPHVGGEGVERPACRTTSSL